MRCFVLVIVIVILVEARWDRSCGSCAEYAKKGGMKQDKCCDIMCNQELKHNPPENCLDNCLKGLSCDGKNPADYQGCADKNAWCSKGGKKYCRDHGAFSGDSCPVSCGQCDPKKKYDGCVDMLKMCPGETKFCNFEWIKNACKKTCNHEICNQ